MVEIPSDQDSWLGEVDHETVYDNAGLETGEDDDDDEADQSRAASVRDRLGL